METAASQALLDKQEITEVIYCYCRAVDRMDRALALSIWAPDASVDYGDIYRGDAVGLVEVIWRIHGTMQAHSHQVSNILIQLAGDEAVSEAYFAASLRPLIQAGTAPTQLNARGRYLDRWVRHNGRWLIAHRQIAADFSDVSPVNDGGFANNGRNNQTDPSYQFLR
jgi:hypothetical protein